jgi:UrcA family protein
MTVCKLILGTSTALLLGATLSLSVTASAETRADALDTITVVAPRVTEQRGPTGQVSKVLKAEMSAYVSFADLDLTRVSDLRALEARVEQAAAGLCKDLEAEMPAGQPSRQACQRRAFETAMAQVHMASQIATAD